MDIIGNLTLEELSETSEQIDQIKQVVGAAQYAISNPDEASKEEVVLLLSILTTVTAGMIDASEMLIDLELVTRPPVTP